jgi:S1-C subfamily serine protease
MDNLETVRVLPPVARRKPAFWWPLATVLIVAVTLTAGLIALYIYYEREMQFRRDELRAEVDTAYLKRQAELKAESEAADLQLASLDQRLRLVSLGFREVARKVAPAVVNIRNEVELPQRNGPRDGPRNPPRPRRGRQLYDFETDRFYLEVGEGSGLLVKPGYVLTNFHVVDKAQRLRVTFASGQSVVVQADAVASDWLTDLAVVRLPAAPPTHLQADYNVTAAFADSDKDVHVGDWVLAVGSPFGLQQTVTAGILSAKARVELRILDQVDLLQTDAAINPGNSGGPLFDQHGRVVGVNVAIASDTGVNQGVGFAIPSNTAREIFDILVEQGEVVRGYLGIEMQEVPGDLARRLGVGDTGAVMVLDVVPGEPAAEAGFRRGDYILSYNHEPVGPVQPMNQLRKRIARTRPDTLVPVEVLRRDERRTLTVKLGKRATQPPPR